MPPAVESPSCCSEALVEGSSGSDVVIARKLQDASSAKDLVGRNRYFPRNKNSGDVPSSAIATGSDAIEDEECAAATSAVSSLPLKAAEEVADELLKRFQVMSKTPVPSGGQLTPTHSRHASLDSLPPRSPAPRQRKTSNLDNIFTTSAKVANNPKQGRTSRSHSPKAPKPVSKPTSPRSVASFSAQELGTISGSIALATSLGHRRNASDAMLPPPSPVPPVLRKNKSAGKLSESIVGWTPAPTHVNKDVATSEIIPGKQEMNANPVKPMHRRHRSDSIVQVASPLASGEHTAERTPNKEDKSGDALARCSETSNNARTHRRTGSGPVSTLLLQERNEKTDVQLLQEKLLLCKLKYGSKSVMTGQAHNELGNYHFAHGSFSDSLSYYRDALKSCDAALGDDSPFAAHTMINIGTVLWRLGELDHAVKSMDLAYRILQKHHGNDHISIGNVLHSLGQALVLRGDYEQATSVLEQALENRKQNNGAKNVDVARTLSVLATARAKNGNADESLRLHWEALKMKESLLGMQNPSTVISMLDVANAYKIAGLDEQALEMLWQALRIQRVLKFSRKVTAKDVGMTLHTMGNLYLKRGQLLKAKKSYNEAYVHYQDAGLSDDDVCIVSLKDSITQMNDSIPENENEEDEP